MTTYTTIAGDRWDALALHLLGNERYMHLLLLANPAYAYLTRLPVRLGLKIPAVPTPDPAPNLPPWRRA